MPHNDNKRGEKMNYKDIIWYAIVPLAIIAWFFCVLFTAIVPWLNVAWVLTLPQVVATIIFFVVGTPAAIYSVFVIIDTFR